MTKIIAVILTVVMAAAVFTACKKDGNTLGTTTSNPSLTSQRDTTTSRAEEAMTDMSEGMSEAGSEVRERADEVGDDIGEGADDIADGVGGAVDEAGDAVSDALD